MTGIRGSIGARDNTRIPRQLVGPFYGPRAIHVTIVHASWPFRGSLSPGANFAMSPTSGRAIADLFYNQTRTTRSDS